MKISMMAAIFAAVLAVATTGCRYDKSGAGAGAGENDGRVSDINGLEDPNSIEGLNGDEAENDAESGSLDEMMGRRFEDYCTLCTDVNLLPVYFGFDSKVIPSSELAKIDEVIRHLNDNSDRVVVIEGNCDERGSNEYNLSLGEDRARTVMNYLEQCEIVPDRIQTRSFGEEKPAAEGHDEESWRLNRRAEFKIYKK